MNAPDETPEPVQPDPAATATAAEAPPGAGPDVAELQDHTAPPIADQPAPSESTLPESVDDGEAEFNPQPPRPELHPADVQQPEPEPEAPEGVQATGVERQPQVEPRPDATPDAGLQRDPNHPAPPPFIAGQDYTATTAMCPVCQAEFNLTATPL